MSIRFVSLGLALGSLALAACAGPVRSSLPSDAPDTLRASARACDRDQVRGCWDVAQALWVGESVARDVDAAVPLLTRACSSNIDEACVLSEEVALPDDAPQTLVDAARACDRGDQAACLTVGAAWRDGDGIARDLDQADRVFGEACAAAAPTACVGTSVVALPPGADTALRGVARACDEGNSQACRALGGRYMRGDGVSADVDRGVALYDRACQLGDASTCAELGTLFMLGGTVAVDVDRAVPLLRRACESGVASACERSEEVRLPAGAPQEVVEAARGCDRGASPACITLASAWRDGAGVTADREHAADLFQRACDASNATACMELGSMRHGSGAGAADALEAARLYDTACRGGELRACYELGTLYRDGAGVPRNLALAFEYWGRACDGGLRDACDSMPGIAEVMLPPSASDVHRNLARQCDRSTWVSCVELANHYRNGAGVPVDYDEANRLLTVACFNGLTDVCDSVRLPGACVASVYAADGALVGIEQFSYDLEALATFGQPDDPTAQQPQSASILPRPPRGGDLFDVDERAAWTWAAVSNPGFFAQGATVSPAPERRQIVVETSRGETVVFTWGPNDRIVSIAETAGGRTRTSTFTWDAAGRLSSYTVAGDGSSTYYDFAWDAAGRLTSALRIETRAGTDLETRYTYTLDARGNMTSMVTETRTITASRETASTWDEIRRVYDAAGNVLRADERDEARQITGTTTYEYSGCYPGVR